MRSNLSVRCLLAIAAAILPADLAAATTSAKNLILLHVTNHRKVALTELHATADGAFSAKILVKGLEPGGSRLVKYQRGRNCFFELHAAYEDGTFTDFRHFDFCKDETINLVD